MRGRRRRDSLVQHQPGLTPAFAGKTRKELYQRRGARAHPRIRGEDHVPGDINAFNRGSPPHSRGRLGVQLHEGPVRGLTPAFAGKTPKPRAGPGPGRAHPRIRGEDLRALDIDGEPWGSPPHSRGRHPRPQDSGTCEGLTPAFAGKTDWRTKGSPLGRAHPRIRGEDSATCASNASFLGSPPHSRGRPCDISI